MAELKENGELPKRVPVRTSKCLNNPSNRTTGESNNGFRPMLGLKSFQTAEPVISGIELAEKIKKKQYPRCKLGDLRHDAGDLASCPGCINGTTLQPTEQDHRIWLPLRIRTGANKSTVFSRISFAKVCRKR